MDIPEPEWKYLSDFAIKKGKTDKDPKGALSTLLAPRRGATKVTISPESSQPPDDAPNGQPTVETLDGTDDLADPTPHDTPGTATAPEVPPSTEPPTPASRQTRSGRTIRNTPRYAQSVTQREQGLVAWEVLLDQDEQEQVYRLRRQ